MSLRIVYTDDFPKDIALQVGWYATKRDDTLAIAYARAVEATLELLSEHPHLGALCQFSEPELTGLRFYLVEKPFHRHLIYYRISGDDLVAFRVVPGARDLPRRILEPSGQ